MTKRGNIIVGLTILGGVGLVLWLRRRQRRQPTGGGLIGLAHGLLTLRGEPYVPIPFAYDSSAIPLESEADLSAIADYLKTNPLISVEIWGHTDSTGSEDYNWNLASDRAQSVYLYLAHQGVGAERMFVVSKGESQPIADNATEEGRAINRRVEFMVV